MDRREFLGMSLSVLALAGCAGGGGGKPADASGMRFTDAERKQIMDFYALQGARKPGRVQPAARVNIGDKLDSGQRPTRLPDDLDKRLPYLNDPYTRLILGADILLVNRNTHDILDVISQVAY